MGSVNVFARWRPLSEIEAGFGQICRGAHSDNGLFSISVNKKASDDQRPWRSLKAFRRVFEAEDDNSVLYSAVVAPQVCNLLLGKSATFFAYGHSGSGKTHTILGYDYQDPQQLGICLAAAKQLFEELHSLEQVHPEQAMCLGFSLFELRKKTAFDLLNRRTPCYIREGSDGKVHIRGETEILQRGKVRVRPIVQRVCSDFDAFQKELQQAIEQRATGKSSTHDQSSRTHAVLQLEVVSQALIEARQELVERQSELVPVGKRAIDISIEEESRCVIQMPDGRWAPNPDYQKDQARIDAIEAEKTKFEARVTDAEQRVRSILESSKSHALGAKLVFVDLAGAEYYEEKGASNASSKRSSQELQEGRQINSDLLALKEVMRAWSQGQNRVPFRSSTLTMVLRELFEAQNQGTSTMIATLSPASNQYAATLNSLKYASLVGTTGA